MSGEVITISEDYSTLSVPVDELIFTKTSKTFTKCAHSFEPPKSYSDTHKCLKCGVNGYHIDNDDGKCDRCFYGLIPQ